MRTFSILAKRLQTIPRCGHQQKMKCHVDPSTFLCRTPCSDVRDCGHKCTGICGKPCPRDCTALVSGSHITLVVLMYSLFHNKWCYNPVHRLFRVIGGVFIRYIFYHSTVLVTHLKIKTNRIYLNNSLPMIPTTGETEKMVFNFHIWHVAYYCVIINASFSNFCHFFTAS